MNRDSRRWFLYGWLRKRKIIHSEATADTANIWIPAYTKVVKRIHAYSLGNIGIGNCKKHNYEEKKETIENILDFWDDVTNDEKCT